MINVNDRLKITGVRGIGNILCNVDKNDIIELQTENKIQIFDKTTIGLFGYDTNMTFGEYMIMKNEKFVHVYCSGVNVYRSIYKNVWFTEDMIIVERNDFTIIFADVVSVFKLNDDICGFSYIEGHSVFWTRTNFFIVCNGGMITAGEFQDSCNQRP